MNLYCIYECCVFLLVWSLYAFGRDLFPKIGLATILFLCTSTGMYGYCSTMQYAPMYTYCNSGEDAIGMFRKIPAKIAICLTNPLSIYFRMII